MKKERETTSQLLQRRGLRPDRKGGFRIVLLLAASILMFAFFADMFWLKPHRATTVHAPAKDIENVLAHLESDDLRYSDSAGTFSIQRPYGWTIDSSPEKTDYDVIFSSPHGPDLRISAMPKDDQTYHSMLQKIEEIQDQYGINMNIEPITFLGYPAIKRTVKLHRTMIVNIDFITPKNIHHIQYGAPHNLFETYQPLFDKLLETYKTESHEEIH